MPSLRRDYAGLVTCLAKDEVPDLTAFDAPEVVWRLVKPFHAGLIVASPDRRRVAALVEDYARRFADTFSAFIPPAASPQH